MIYEKGTLLFFSRQQSKIVRRKFIQDYGLWIMDYGFNIIRNPKS